MAMICWSPTCGKAIDPTAAACPSCGAPLLIRDKYRIVRLIGQGGMGVVYEVIDERLGRRAALKMMHGRHAERSSTRQRFETECRAMAALDHPGIARIYDADAHHDQLFFVQQLVPGKTLQTALAEAAPSVDIVIELGLDLLRALDHAHGHGVIHRDVNLNNVMLIERDGALHAVLIDFGMARLSEQGATRAAWGGTPGFAAPEQILDPTSNDRRSDLFAVAMVLYALLTRGVTAYASVLADDAIKSPTALVQAYQRIFAGQAAPTPLQRLNPLVPPALEAVIMRGLSAQLDARFQTAVEMGTALLACRAGAGQGPRPEVASPSIVAAPAAASARVSPAPDLTAAPTASASSGSLGNFVEREREIDRLLGYLASALDGRLQVCNVVGDAGTGKSALIHEVVRRAEVREPALICAFGECAAQSGPQEPFLPIREVLLDLIGRPEEVTARRGVTAPRGRAASARALVGRALVQVAPQLIGKLLPRSQLPTWLLDSAPAAAEAGDLGREQLFGLVADLIRALAREAPLVIVLDNLQWIDGASVELLAHLDRALRDVRVLFVGAYRPSEVAALGGKHPLDPLLTEIKRQSGDVWIDLDELGAEARRAFVEALIERQPNRLSRAFREELFERTQGHALFTVELLRAMREGGMIVEDAEARWIEAPGLSWPSLPSRVEGVVEQRIQRLDDALRETLTVASVGGRTFIAQAVATARGLPARDLLRQLTQELDRKHRLVQEVGARRTPQGLISEFRFRNVLAQRYLYDQLSESERMMLHGDLAAALEKLFGSETGEVAVALARHFDAAGEPEKAIEYLQRAADLAMGVGAYEEAARGSERALVRIAEAPDSADRAAQELSAQLRLANVAKVRRGWASAETKAAYDRARATAGRVGDAKLLAPALLGLWSFYLVRGELLTAREVAKEIEDLGDKTGEAHVRIEACFAQANTMLWTGDLAGVAVNTDRCASLYDPSGRAEHHVAYGQDPFVLTQLFGMWGAWMEGRLRAARAHGEAAMRRAEALAHPFTLAIAMQGEAVLGYHERDIDRAHRAGARLAAFAKEHGFPPYVGIGAMFVSWAQALRGEGGGAELMKQAFLTWAGLPDGLACTLEAVMLGEAHLRAGELDLAARALDEGLANAARHHERLYVPELRRLLGEVRLAQGARGAAEELFQSARAEAEAMGARMPALRAAASLGRARVTAAPPLRAEARALLEAALGALPEVIEVPDVTEARAALSALSAQA